MSPLQKQSLIVALIFLFSFPNCTSSRQSYSHYSNLCAPTKCGDSLLRFPLGLDPLCRSANLATSCDNGAVFRTAFQTTKYKLLDSLNETIYARKSIRLVDGSLLGCDPITRSYEDFSQIWLFVGSLTVSKDYRMATFINCTREPQGDILSRLTRAPCLECEESSNLCYSFNGYMANPIPYCRSFITAIPNEWSNNWTGVGNLRRALQEGLRVEWDSLCGEDCMDKAGGRCGFMDEERKIGSEICFRSLGAHKTNCSDGK